MLVAAGAYERELLEYATAGDVEGAGTADCGDACGRSRRLFRLLLKGYPRWILGIIWIGQGIGDTDGASLLSAGDGAFWGGVDGAGFVGVL